MAPAEHRNVSGHAQQIGTGEFVGPEQVGKLDPAAKDEAAAQHDAALIEAGAFIPLKEAKSAKGDE